MRVPFSVMKDQFLFVLLKFGLPREKAELCAKLFEELCGYLLDECKAVHASVGFQ